MSGFLYLLALTYTDPFYTNKEPDYFPTFQPHFGYIGEKSRLVNNIGRVFPTKKNMHFEGVAKYTLPVGNGGLPLDDDGTPSISNETVLLPRLGALLLCCRLFPIGVITLSRRRGIDGALERSTRGWDGRGGFLWDVALGRGCLPCASTASGSVSFSSLMGT